MKTTFHKSIICLIIALIIFNKLNANDNGYAILDYKNTTISNTLNKANNLENNNTREASVIYQTVLDSLLNVNLDAVSHNFYVAKTLNAYSRHLIIYASDFDKALEYAFNAKEILEKILIKIGDQRIMTIVKAEIGVINLNIGRVYEKRGYYDEAIRLYISADKLFKKNNNSEYEALAYANMAHINNNIGNYREAKSYYYKSLKIINKANFTFELGEIYQGLGLSNYNLGFIDSAAYYYNKALFLYEKMDNQKGMAVSFFLLGEIHAMQNSYYNTDKALTYYQKALYMAGIIENKFYLSKIYNSISSINGILKDFGKAKEYALKSLTWAKELNSPYLKCLPLKNLAAAYEGLGFPDSANFYLEQHKLILDSLYGGISDVYLSESSAKDVLEAYEKKWHNEKAEFQKKIIAILIAVLILTIILSVLIYGFTKKNAENKNKIKVRDSLLAGEEKERQRIGQELHDGVCSDLSAIKMNLQLLKNKYEAKDDIEKIINTVNEINENIRLISHNLNSVVLIKFGLIAAVHNLCEKMKDLDLFSLQTDIVPDIKGPVNDITITTAYRILQELFNNIIKHAKADKVIFNLKQKENLIIIQVHDNGVGFNLKTREDDKGIGLNNIIYRVGLINGKITINSAVNAGTKVDIEIPVT